MSPRKRVRFATLPISNSTVRMYWARGGDAHQLFGRQDEGDLVAEAAQPVDPVYERGHLRVVADLAQLLVAAVHVAGDGVGPHDLFAVEADDHAQRAVGGRVLRADVQRHALGLEL